MAQIAKFCLYQPALSGTSDISVKLMEGEMNWFSIAFLSLQGAFTCGSERIKFLPEDVIVWYFTDIT